MNWCSEVGRAAIFVAAAAAVVACAGDSGQGKSAGLPDAPDAGKGTLADSVRDALTAIEVIYLARPGDVQAAAPAGVFNAPGLSVAITSDVAYLRGRLALLLDGSTDSSARAASGAEALTFLVAGYGATQRPEFSMAAHTVLDYLRSLTGQAGAGDLAFRAHEASLQRLEQQLIAFEIACGCR
jgi:hypothetical protein